MSHSVQLSQRDSEPLHVGRPNIGDRARFLERIGGVLDRNMLTNGPLVREFERRLAAFAGVRHCVATCNATTGIQIAVRAAGVQPGDEVIVPAFTWIATPHALSWIGVVPVCCDIDPGSGNIDPEQVQRLIGPRTRGILAVHVFGRPCDTAELGRIAGRHGLALVYDAAHAIGCTSEGRPIGGHGAAEVFSFHATKYLNSFEGGAVVTDDGRVAVAARAMRNFGIDDDGDVAMPGTNGKMTEAAAAMGLTSLDEVGAFLAANRRNHDRYVSGLAGLPGIRVRPPAPGERANHQYVVIEVDAAAAGLHRDDLHAALTRENVLSRRYFTPCCHHSEPYRSNPARHAPLPTPRADALAGRVLALPTGTAVGAEQVARVCDAVTRALAVGHRRPGV